MFVTPAKLAQLEAHKRQMRQTIKDHGWTGIGIYDDPKWTGFTYSVGFWKTARRPEVIISGLPHQESTRLIWCIYNAVKNKPSLAIGTPIKGIFNLPCVCFSVTKSVYADRLSAARWFNDGDNFPCIQVIYPDANGYFPWDDKCEEDVRGVQPDLTENGWLATLAQ